MNAPEGPEDATGPAPDRVTASGDAGPPARHTAQGAMGSGGVRSGTESDAGAGQAGPVVAEPDAEPESGADSGPGDGAADPVGGEADLGSAEVRLGFAEAPPADGPADPGGSGAGTGMGAAGTGIGELAGNGAGQARTAAGDLGPGGGETHGPAGLGAASAPASSLRPAGPTLARPSGPPRTQPAGPARTQLGAPVGRSAHRRTRAAHDGWFFGRQRELKALHGDIERAGLNTISGRKEPRARVLLVAGRPGSGRTALAEELVGRLRGGYPDGVVRIGLTEAGGEPVPTERTTREILDAFEVATPPGADEDELCEMVRETLAVRRVLLLLDDAGDAEQVDPLVPDNPECLVVAVAQGPLTGIPDVRPCTLGGMDTKAAIELLGRFTGEVRITVDPQAAESLVEECGGQPAAIVLAGGWLAARPMASVADLTKQLRAQPHDPERPVGDRALARAFRLVYESLPQSAARMLRLLALAPAGYADAHTASALAGCSVTAAATMLDDFTALGLLRVADERAATGDAPDQRTPDGRTPDGRTSDGRTPDGRTSDGRTPDGRTPDGRGTEHRTPDTPGTDQRPSDQWTPDQRVSDHLVPDHWVPDDGVAVDPAADDQYALPGCLVPLLHALLREKDRPAEVQLARARMLERTVRLLQSCRAITEPEGSQARTRLAGLPSALRFPDTGSAAEWLRSRQPALLASARLAVADGELDTLARRLVAALVRALAAHRGAEAAAPELYGLHQLVLDIAERRELFREQAAALLNIGDLDARNGRTRAALTRYRAALDAGRAANDLYATGRAMESVGGAYQDLQDWTRAADWYGRALSQRLSRGEKADEARLYGRLGTVHTYAGRYGEALRNWRAATAVHRRLRDLPGQARALSEAARVQEYAGRPQESLRTCREAIEWARLAGDERLQAALELRAADTLDRLGDPTAARLHRAAADRLLGTEGGEGPQGTEGTEGTEGSACEIRSASTRD
ncbi:tetratricopeptide repeat protein [Streptomyces sp. NPDC088116]|uniref:tetratricopeptide repeat protein n=1 Tax=Streptomyces sp. NPDC088116 TaxID=3365825 RepID=UPI0038137A2D